MTGFEPRICGVISDRPTNCTTTTATVASQLTEQRQRTRVRIQSSVTFKILLVTVCREKETENWPFIKTCVIQNFSYTLVFLEATCYDNNVYDKDFHEGFLTEVMQQ